MRLLWLLLGLALAQDAADEPEAEPELIPGVQNAGLPPQAPNRLRTLDEVSSEVQAATGQAPMLQGVAPPPPPIQVISGLPAPPPPIEQAGLPPNAPPLPMIDAELPDNARVWINEPGKWLEPAEEEEDEE